MHAGDDAGPLERSWLCCGFRILESDDWDRPEVIEAEKKITALMLPEDWAGDPELREVAAGFAIGELFRQRYGTLMLIRGIMAWPTLADQLAERDREAAAD